MSLPKQRPGESDSDYQARLEDAKRRKREYLRQYREANKEAIGEYYRQWYEAHKEAMSEYQRQYREANKEARREWRNAKILAHAKGKPLKSNLIRAQRPRLLTKLLLEMAEVVVKDWGFGDKWDTHVLREAAARIRNSRYLAGKENPWYCTDYLHESLVGTNDWATRLRKRHRTR